MKHTYTKVMLWCDGSSRPEVEVLSLQKQFSKNYVLKNMLDFFGGEVFKIVLFLC